MTLRNKKIRGFTMIELLIVFAVIAVLIAILLPAISNCREAARRVQCINNLYQLSIGVQNYNMAFNVLPPGTVNETGPVENLENGYHMSWMVQLLPQMESAVVFDAIDFSKSAYDRANDKARSEHLVITRCPSDPIVSANRWPTTSYAACTGGIDEPVTNNNTGLFFLNSSIRYAQIRDGASNTVMIGERLRDDNPTGIDLGWMSGTSATLRNTGMAMNAGNTSSVQLNLRSGGFSSSHNGLVQAAMADGSIRAFNNATNPSVWQKLGNREDGEIQTLRF